MGLYSVILLVWYWADLVGFGFGISGVYTLPSLMVLELILRGF